MNSEFHVLFICITFGHIFYEIEVLNLIFCPLCNEILACFFVRQLALRSFKNFNEFL
jgi:hypothetical protein